MAARTYDYIIAIKPSRNHEAFNWITQLLLFIAVAILSYDLYRSPYGNISTLAGIIFLLMIAGGWIYSRVTASGYRFALLWTAVCFFTVMKNPWLGFAFLVLTILEKQVKFKQELGFDNEGVSFNSFPKKTYQWHEVNNVVLKDGIITVDLHNNKLFQKELESDVTLAMEKEFNEFCRSQMFSFAAKA
jgi:hypothetical protein